MRLRDWGARAIRTGLICMRCKTPLASGPGAMVAMNFIGMARAKRSERWPGMN